MKRNRLLSIGLVLIFLVAVAYVIVNYSPEEFDKEAAFALLESNAEDWGLGEEVEEYVSNDRPYQWYVDQGDTGEHASKNCGPSSVVMAGNWVDRTFSPSAAELRELIPAADGWWYSNNINDALNQHNMEFDIIEIQDYTTLVDIIDSGNIAILNNDMGHIPHNPEPEERVQRFYDYSSGHYFVLKGYAIVDGNLFFEVYDPNSYGSVYEDGQLKGKNRYYAEEELLTSLDWWPRAVVIYP